MSRSNNVSNLFGDMIGALVVMAVIGGLAVIVGHLAIIIGVVLAIMHLLGG